MNEMNVETLKRWCGISGDATKEDYDEGVNAIAALTKEERYQVWTHFANLANSLNDFEKVDNGKKKL